MSKSFKVGDRVGLVLENSSNNMSKPKFDIPLRWKSEEGVEYEKGVVTDVLSNGCYLVKWSDDYFNQQYGSFQFKAEALDFPKNIKLKIKELEKEFNAVSKEIGEKIKAATQLINEANTLANKVGADLSSDFYYECHSLLYEMDAAGWSTSSLSC